ncbi:3914_t:CDS:1, partial [Racocetra persica]
SPGTLHEASPGTLHKSSLVSSKKRPLWSQHILKKLYAPFKPPYRKSQDQLSCISQIPQRKSSHIPRLAFVETLVQSRLALNDVSNLFSPVTYQDIKEFND